MRRFTVLKIKDRSKVPKELYDYTVPETQATFTAHSIGLLLVKIEKHYRANNLASPETLSQIVEADWCSRREWHCEDTERVRPEKHKPEGDALNSLLASVAIPAADALATVSKALGIDCSKCQTRHRIIKEMKKRGFTETLRLLKETLHA